MVNIKWWWYVSLGRWNIAWYPITTTTTQKQKKTKQKKQQKNKNKKKQQKTKKNKTKKQKKTKKKHYVPFFLERTPPGNEPGSVKQNGFYY